MSNEVVHSLSVPSDQARFWLSTLTESADAGFIGKDLAGVIITWNKGAERLFGYTPREIVGRSISTIIPPDRLEEEATSNARIKGGETYVRLDTERLRRDGLRTPVSLTMSPVLDEAGTTIGISVIARDLRKAHLIEAELLRREAVLRSILDTVPDALVIVGETGTIQSFSAAAARLFCRTQEEVIGAHVRMLIPAYDEYVTHYLRTGERRISGVGRNVVALRNDGGTFPIELSLGEVAVPGLRLFTGFIRDLTEHQDRERRMRELRAELVHIARLNELGQMVSALAHEVAQPLASLVNYLSGIRRLLASGRWETAEQAVQRATEQAHRAMKIVQRLREFVRKGQTHKQVEDLRETIREAGALALLGVAQDFELQVDVSPNAERAVIDKIQIQQVLLNLVRNATDAMSPRGHGKLSIVVRRADNMAEISVTDDGPGLSESVRSKLFQPFVTSKPTGMGVGLSVCRTIVEAHGGEIWAEDTWSSGAVFRFTVPVPEAGQDESPPA